MCKFCTILFPEADLMAYVIRSGRKALKMQSLWKADLFFQSWGNLSFSGLSPSANFFQRLTDPKMSLSKFLEKQRLFSFLDALGNVSNARTESGKLQPLVLSNKSRGKLVGIDRLQLIKWLPEFIHKGKSLDASPQRSSQKINGGGHIGYIRKPQKEIKFRLCDFSLLLQNLEQKIMFLKITIWINSRFGLVFRTQSDMLLDYLIVWVHFNKPIGSQII